jgi:hypothetical protein
MSAASGLSSEPPAPVRDLGELFAVAFDLAQTNQRNYRAAAASLDDDSPSARRVFDALATRERDRADHLVTLCTTTCGRPPHSADLRWKPAELVPAAELAEITGSHLATAYDAWALAVRHRQRAFVFWTYVIAVSEPPAVKAAAETMAHEALVDGDLLRRERRMAWRAERHAAEGEAASREPASAALLESLLFKDVMAWSQLATPAERAQLSRAVALPPHGPQPPAAFDAAGIADLKRRALSRAEQLSNLYLDAADRAADQASMELAQKLAAQSIARLAALRRLAAASR